MKVIVKLIAFLLTMMPFAAFADGEDVTTIVRAFTYDEGGDVTKNVGNVKVTTKYSDISAAGILAEAESNRTAKVTAKDVDVNVPSADYQTGVEVWSGDSAGTVNITTNNIKSGEHGIWTDIQEKGSKATVTVNGDIEAGAYDTDYSYRMGRGIIANVRNGGTTDVTVNGNVKAVDKGILVSAVGDKDPATGGTANIEVYGDVIAENTHNAALGIDFSGHTDKADVLVTGVISGSDAGVNTDNYYYYSTGESKLTVWKIASASGKLVTKRVGSTQYGTDDEFAKKINYIIRHDPDVLLKKADGSAINTSHGFPVAKEGEKVIIDTNLDGVYVTKAMNHGVKVTTRDAKGNLYFTVERGGGIDLVIETAEMGDGIPARYNPDVPTDVLATPKTKVLPLFYLSEGNTVKVYYERFAGGVFKVGDKKLGKTKYEVMLKTKNKKKKATTKIVKQTLTKNYRTINLKQGQSVTVKYRVAITKKVGKKSVTKRTKWSKAERFDYLPIN